MACSGEEEVRRGVGGSYYSVRMMMGKCWGGLLSKNLFVHITISLCLFCVCTYGYAVRISITLTCTIVKATVGIPATAARSTLGGTFAKRSSSTATYSAAEPQELSNGNIAHTLSPTAR